MSLASGLGAPPPGPAPGAVVSGAEHDKARLDVSHRAVLNEQRR